MGSTNTKKLVNKLFEEDDLNNLEIVKTFKPKNELSDKIFDSSLQMHENIRKRLLKISDLFLEYIGIDFFVYDIVLTGSLANYNWSKYSDIDLHILIDMNEFNDDDSKSELFKEIIKEFFMVKKSLWNDRHDIKVKSYEVELYVEDVNEEHVSSGVYSILNDEWIIKPQKMKEEIDERKILEKSDEYSEMIDNLIQFEGEYDDIMDRIQELTDKIKRFRKSGLEKGGEYSYENLTFKLLRRNGYIKKLYDFKKEVTNKKLSIDEKDTMY